jgi:Asp-tRNA(Asn)/Glu-tRNA(Gln) amidotransferase A subunit family amidase
VAKRGAGVTDIMDLDALAVARAVRSRSISPVDVVNAATHRIETFNPLLNAVVRRPSSRRSRRHAGRRRNWHVARIRDRWPVSWSV